MLKRIEEELRATGNERDARYADIIKKIHEERGIDLPFGGSKSPEANIDAKRFSDQAREALEQEGYVIYTLTGSSLRELELQSKLLSLGTYKEDHYVEYNSSATEVALNPDKFFIKDSAYLMSWSTYRAINEASTQIKLKMGDDVQAIMGEANQYIELAILYFQKYGQNLLGNSPYNYVWTKTEKITSQRNNYIIVGGYENEHIGINHKDKDSDGIRHFAHGELYLWVAPLIIPS